MTRALFAKLLAQRVNRPWARWGDVHCDSWADAPDDEEIAAIIQEALDAEFPPEQESPENQ